MLGMFELPLKLAFYLTARQRACRFKTCKANTHQHPRASPMDRQWRQRFHFVLRASGVVKRGSSWQTSSLYGQGRRLFTCTWQPRAVHSRIFVLQPYAPRVTYFPFSLSSKTAYSGPRCHCARRASSRRPPCLLPRASTTNPQPHHVLTPLPHSFSHILKNNTLLCRKARRCGHHGPYHGLPPLHRPA